MTIDAADVVRRLRAAGDHEAATLIETLVRERDEAVARVEELEADQETVSAEFEGDCWRALRSLLDECHFDWQLVDHEGVTADDAREHVRETLRELERGESDARKRAEAAESALRQANARIAEMEGVLRTAEDHLAATTDLGWHQNEAVKVVRAVLRSQSEETR